MQALKTRSLLTLLLVLVGLGLAVPAWSGGQTAAAKGPVTLVFSDWHLAEPHWEKALKEAFVVFEKENPDIKVQLDVVSYGEKETKYTTEIEAKTGPDVFHLHAYSIKSFMEKGYLMDITPYIKEEGSGFMDTWYPQTVELMKNNGSYFAMPGDFMSMVLFYNKNLYKEAGLDPAAAPETWDQFLANAKKLTRDRSGDGKTDTWGFGTIGAIDPGFELRVTPILFSQGGAYLTEGNKCSALSTSEAKQAFRFFTSLVTEHGVVPPGVTAQNPGTVRQQMASEQIAMLLGSGWTPPIVDGNNPELNALEVLEAAPVPVKAGSSPKFTTTAWLSAWMINPHTDYPDQSWTLVKFITSKEMEQKWFDDARVLSARKDVSGHYNPLLNDKFAKVIASQLSKAKFVPQIKEWPQVIEAVNAAAQEAFTKTKAADQALKDAHNRINDILKVYRSSGDTCPSF